MGKSSLSLSLLLISCFFVFGCSSTKCRRYHNLSDATKTKWVGADAKSADAPKVKIYKEDGSLQCGMGQSIDPNVMKEELDDIQVFSVKNASDGLMHIQACGTPTGRINIYEIRQVDVDRATKKGFKILEE